MSGDSEAPPTYYFSGITFNSTFYTSASGDYLTKTTAKQYFLSYPTAQGVESISTLYSSTIDSGATSSALSIGPSQTDGILNIGSNSTTATRTTGAINIGTNVFGNTPINIGTTSKSTTTLNGIVNVTTKIISPTVESTTSGTSMYLGSNIDTGSLFLGSVISTGSITIGRESGNHTGAITIGDSQTSGIMNIATKSTRSGALNINNTSGQTNSINIGTTGTPVSITGNTVSIDGALKLGTAQTTGTMEIATSATRSGNLFIASTTGQTNNIYIGASGTKTILDGTVSSNSLNGLTLGAAQTIGGIITSGSITIGGALTSGSMTLGGVQTTGDINIGNKNATGDIYIGNGTNSTTGANTGICSIQKLQVGNTTLNSGNGIGTGTPFRLLISAQVAGGGTTGTGTVTIPGAPATGNSPHIFAQINSGTTSLYSMNVNPVNSYQFTYNKFYWTGTTFSVAPNEAFDYIAIWY